MIASGCGGSGGEAASSASIEHIHGLGVNPKDQSLVVATHNGLYRVPAGSGELTRIGESDNDFMGFTVVGPDEFLGSGHPATLSNAVNPLGLIRSNDGGLAWTNVSLEGEADFHSLRTSGQSVYGLVEGRLLASADGGQTWDEGSAPVELFDVAIDPGDTDHIVAASDQGLYSSKDGGGEWRRVSDRVGLLAWAPADALHLVDGTGATHVSTNGGKTWSHAGQAGGLPAALYASGDDQLYAALDTGAIVESADGGTTWSTRVQP